MIFQESETVERKAIVVEDIKKKSLLLQTAKEENCTSAFRMMEQFQDWITQTKLLCRSAIWFETQLNRI